MHQNAKKDSSTLKMQVWLPAILASMRIDFSSQTRYCTFALPVFFLEILFFVTAARRGGMALERDSVRPIAAKAEAR